MSIRTVIDFSPLSETTIALADLGRVRRRAPPAGVPVPASPFLAFAAARSLRRCSPCALRASARWAARSSGLSCGPASCGRRERCSLPPLLPRQIVLRIGSAAAPQRQASSSAPAPQRAPPRQPPAHACSALGLVRPSLAAIRISRGWRGGCASGSSPEGHPPRQDPRARSSIPRRQDPRPRSSSLSSSARRRSYPLSVSFSTSISRSRATSAASRCRASPSPTRAVFSSSPVAWRKRRLNASCLASISFATSSSSLRLWDLGRLHQSLRPLALHEFGPHRRACARRGAAPRAPGPRARRQARTSPCRA